MAPKALHAPATVEPCAQPFWPRSSPGSAAAQQDLPPYVLNATLGEFERQFVPSEENPDDGKRLVWLPCPEELGVEVESACEQVRTRLGSRPRTYCLRARNACASPPPPHMP